MGKRAIVFLVSFVLAFGVGYLFWEAAPEPGAAKKEETVQATPAATTGATVAAKEAEILGKKGCLGCHAVSSLKVKGGSAGPDLSKAYENVESKHGLKIEDFLKKPTSAVMAGVIGGSPLTDEELKAVIATLKAAAEK